ncbi:MAG: hypothetical protein KGH71_00975 [Candidatus Micrarchaeota archaeon]|nr:hypothetical protein [Candidatus Micrarchaeota archaeon]
MYFANTEKLLSANSHQRRILLNAYAEARRALDMMTSLTPEKRAREKEGKTTTQTQKGNNDVACKAVKEYLEKTQPRSNVYYFGPSKTGETNEIAREVAKLLKKIADGKSEKYKAPCFVIQGYVDTTITMAADLSYGGKSIHQALVMMDELGGDTRISGMCVKTNWDGNTCSTGGIFDYYAWQLLARTGNAKEMMKLNESFAIMKGIGATVDTKKIYTEKARILIAEVRPR